MQKNSEDFSMQEVMRLAKSPAGQQLLAMLQQADNGQLQQAVKQANTGDYKSAANTLQELLCSQEAQALIKQLGG